MNLNFLLLLNTGVFLKVAGTPLQLESKKNVLMISLLHITGIAEQWVQGMQLAPPIFGSSVNPIRNRGGQIMPTNYYWHPHFFSPSCNLIHHILTSFSRSGMLSYWKFGPKSCRLWFIPHLQSQNVFCTAMCPWITLG